MVRLGTTLWVTSLTKELVGIKPPFREVEGYGGQRYYMAVILPQDPLTLWWCKAATALRNPLGL